MKKVSVITGIAAAAILVSACHQNPLTSHDKKKTASFVLDASTYAEKIAGKNVRGSAYKQCMTENVQNIDCPKLFNDMATFAKDSTDFKGLTVADLKDKPAFNKIAAIYESTRFNRF